MNTLTNDFHGTEYRTSKTTDEVQRISDAHYGGRPLTSAESQWAHKVRRALCCADCQCARTPLGER